MKDIQRSSSQSIITNAKLRRPEICGATETLLIHQDHTSENISYVLDDLKSQGCEIIGCENFKRYIQLID